MIVDMRSSLRDLQGDAFQHFMRGKEKKLFVEDGRSHWRNTKMQNDEKLPEGVEWMWMGGKRLVNHLQVYDTGQQEAMLRWLLLREFGQENTYPLSWGVKKEEE